MEKSRGIFHRLFDRFIDMKPVRFLLLGYCTVVLVGALLLCLPISNSMGEWTSFSDALFTSTSAACVTGLIRFDTYVYWSFFGQVVIILLIQVGGVGFMSLAIGALVIFKKRVGYQGRSLMQNALSVDQRGGIVRVARFVLRGTALVEGIGALLLSFYYVPKIGLLEGIWYSVFHSISAFCNAGFDLMGQFLPGSSIMLMNDNWYVNIIIMALITMGGLGFLVWRDLMEKRFRFSKLRLHSKIVVVTSLLLTFGGALVIFLLENGTVSFQDLPFGVKVLGSLFQSVTCRTAGFYSLDLSTFTGASIMVMIILMLAGGSPGSTAGGVKTTTFAVQFFSVTSVLRGKKAVEAYGRRFSDSALRTATCVCTIYMVGMFLSAMVIAKIEGLDYLTCLFETTSAIATVGLTLGITPYLGLTSKIILILLMLFGRTGSLTFLMAFAKEKKKKDAKYPVEEVGIG